MRKSVQIGFAAAGCVLGAAIGIARPFSGLSPEANAALGILVGAIIWWVVGIVPEFVTAILMALLFILIAGVPIDVTFATFASSTWWLLVAAFCLGLGMQKSGLMRRMALGILRVFPKTFRAQTAGLMAAGTLIGPFIPSLAAKAVMLAPLSLGISDSLGYERKSAQANGIFLAMFTGVRNVGPAIISASFMGYGIVALLPPDVQAQFNMVQWFLAALPWFIVVMVLNYLMINLLYRPKNPAASSKVNIETDAADAAAPAAVPATAQATDASAEAQPELGPWSGQEKAMLCIMVATVALWVLEPLHGIDAYIVALAATAATVICGIFGPKEFRSGIAWDSLIFIGIAMGLADVFGYLGIDVWIVEATGPLFTALAQNPFAFVLGIGLTTVALRFIIVSEMAYINIAMAFIVPLAMGAGINPWIVGFCIYALLNPWFVPYQNSIYLTAYYAVDGKMVRHRSMAAYCAIYIPICLLGLAVSVPYWQLLGLF